MQNVLAAGGTIAGGAVARAACCLEELEYTWDVSDLDIYAEQGDSVESIVGAIDRFTSSLGKGWKAVHERAPPNAPRYESNSEVLRVRKIRITKACPREARPPAGMTSIDIIETRAHGARAVQYFDINVCRVALVQGSLLFVGGPTRYNGVEDPPNVTRGAPLGPLAAVNGGTPLTLRATATAATASAMSVGAPWRLPFRRCKSSGVPFAVPCPNSRAGRTACTGGGCPGCGHGGTQQARTAP